MDEKNVIEALEHPPINNTNSTSTVIDIQDNLLKEKTEKLQKKERSNTSFNIVQQKMKDQILSSLIWKNLQIGDKNKGFNANLKLPSFCSKDSNNFSKKGYSVQVAIDTNSTKNKLSKIESKKLGVSDIKQETNKSLEIKNEDDET